MLPERQINFGWIDFLTGINNRRYFDERLSKEISHSLRYQKSLSCLLIDIDCFEQYKKNYGYINGEKILNQVAQRIESRLRTTDVVGRYSEEEFAVLLIEADIDHARNVAERIQKNIQNQQIELEGQAIEITVSVGVSDVRQAEKKDHSAKSLGEMMLATADCALRNAKRIGRNQVHCMPLSS